MITVVFDYFLVSNIWQATKQKEEVLNPRIVNILKVYSYETFPKRDFFKQVSAQLQ